MSNTHESIMAAIQTYSEENQKFTEKGVKASGTRARKALAELGLDLNGQVHKTVNFTKKSDPNEDVRAIASECYKAVRRHAKKDSSVQDIKRSIIAAEWWLLMCQRTELGHEIDSSI